MASPTATATEVSTATPTATPVVCIGNCNGDASVSVDELVTMVGITLETLAPSTCPEGLPGGAATNVAMVVRAVDNALGACAAP